MRRRRAPRALAALGVVAAALACVVGAAEPAAAHGTAGHPPVDHSTVVREIVPQPDGLRARITDVGERVEITSTGPEVLVLGYDGEPYLRIDDDGVWRNERSPATFLNRSLVVDEVLPPSFDAEADPEWVRIDSGATVSWHDHRLHPSGTGATSTWQIAMLVDDVPTAILGETTRRTPPPVWSAVALVLGAAVGSASALRSRRPAALAGFAALIVVATVALSVARWQATTDASGSRVAPLAPVAFGVLLLVGIARLRRGLHAAAPWLVFGFGALALSFGVALVPWLTHAVLPAVGPAPLWRLVVAIVLGGGVAGVAVCAGAIAARPPTNASA